MELTIRPRRLRTSDTLRRMVRETRVSPDSLIYPLFLVEGRTSRNRFRLWRDSGGFPRIGSGRKLRNV